MDENDDITKKYLVWYFKGSEIKTVPTDSCHGTNIRTKVRVPFNNERLGKDVLVKVDEFNHILMIQKDIRTFAVVTFNVEVHGVGIVRELERRWGGILKFSSSFFLSISLWI